MKCSKCGEETRHAGTSQTLVGYGSPDGHDHDDNCLKRRYECVNGHAWVESVRRRCPAEGCDWRGKADCFCHEGSKVEAWSDPDDYYTQELQDWMANRKPDPMVNIGDNMWVAQSILDEWAKEKP